MRGDAKCESCGFVAEALGVYRTRKGQGYKALCLICAETFAGEAFEFPDEYCTGSEGRVMKMLAHCTNMILQQMKESA